MKIRPEIEFFLHMGYFPGYPEKVRLDYNGLNREIYERSPRGKLLDEGALLWREAVTSGFEPGRRHVVPLSGGLDSRAILAVLLEFTSADNIETYTFGTPGTCDYDIGCMVARKAGTRHQAIPLDSVEWKEEDFTDASFRFNHQTLLFHHAPTWLLDRFSDGLVWSGYLGDFVTGAHQPAQPSQSLHEARVKYLAGRSAVKSMRMTEAPLEELASFVGGGTISSDSLCYDEQVLAAEVGKFTAPHVLMNGFDYITPFVNNAFWDFFLSIPGKYRSDQKLYKAMLLREWPDLFSLPTKSHYGLPLKAMFPRVAMRRLKNRAWNLGRAHFKLFDWPPLPMTNYIDMDLLIRKNPGFRNLLLTQTEDLKKRDIVPWIDIDGIWERHMKRRENHGDTLKILFSLEMNLKGLENQSALGKVVGL